MQFARLDETKVQGQKSLKTLDLRHLGSVLVCTLICFIAPVVWMFLFIAPVDWIENTIGDVGLGLGLFEHSQLMNCEHGRHSDASNTPHV